jgi:SAM-dependent methyltransferase
VWTDLQYRILKRISPREPHYLSGATYAGKSKIKILLGERVLQELRGKVVVDFGCGDGYEAIELAQNGARLVIGIDSREAALDRARENARRAGMQDVCVFSSEGPEGADAIISLDGFEHFGDPGAILRTMYDLLKPGGVVYASFGPTWYHPLGGHLFSVFPWAHLMFSERALIRWRSDLRTDGAMRFGEVEGGLNGMTIARFERLLKAGPLAVASFETKPIRKLRFVHNRLTREFTTSVVRCKLIKRICPQRVDTRRELSFAVPSASECNAPTCNDGGQLS